MLRQARVATFNVISLFVLSLSLKFVSALVSSQALCGGILKPHLIRRLVSFELPLSWHTEEDTGLQLEDSLRSLKVHSRTHNLVVTVPSASILNIAPQTGLDPL